MLRSSFLLSASAMGATALGESHPLVSPAGSGPAPRWGASTTDRSGNVDRFAAERHWRSLTPSHALTVQKRIAYRHGRGRKYYSLIPKGEALPPPLATPLREALSVASGDSVSPAGSVGAERCPPGTCAPIGGAELSHPLPPPVNLPSDNR